MGVLWITGLSGSGKSTLSHELIAHTSPFKWIHLDGDELRLIFLSENKYDKSSRLNLATKYSRLASLISSQGFNVIVSTISLFQEIHEWNRENIENYFEVYIDANIEDLKKRNAKDIYSLSHATNVTGIDIGYDEPIKSHYVIKQNFDRNSLNHHTKMIVSQIEWLSYK